MFPHRTATARIAVLLFITSAATLPARIAPAMQDPGHVYDPGHDQGLHREWKGDPYLLTTDPVSGGALGPIEKQVVLNYEGRELRFATRENADLFRADPAKFLAKADAKIILEQRPYYPLDTCVLSGRKLGELGEPFDFVFKNRLVRLSSADGKLAFLQDPAKYIQKLDQAVVAKQKPTYPLETCVVSGEKFGGEMGAPVDHVVGNRLVRFCCKDCAEQFRKDPSTYLLKLDAARKADVSGDRPTPAVTYTCPMHSEIASKEQGKCPKCGMNLVPKK